MPADNSRDRISESDCIGFSPSPNLIWYSLVTLSIRLIRHYSETVDVCQAYARHESGALVGEQAEGQLLSRFVFQLKRRKGDTQELSDVED